MDYLKSMFFEEEMCERFEFNMQRIRRKERCDKMVSQSIQTHIFLESDGPGSMLCVFSGSVDRLEWVSGGQN